MTHLYLFTSQFPFGGGESFLEEELPLLARLFDQVTVLPTREVGASEPPRVLPEGVALDLALAGRGDDVGAMDDLAFKLTSGAREALRRPRTALRRLDLQRVWYYQRQAARARRWLRDQELTESILCTYWLDGITFGLATGRRQKAVVVSRAHRGDLYEAFHPSGYLPFLPRSVALLDQLYCVSEHGRKHLVGRWPHLRDKVRVARLGVPDPHHVTPASSDGVFRIVTCSHFKPVKRIPRIIDGIAHFASQQADLRIEWRHIGDGAGRKEIEARAADRLPPNVDGVFLGRLPPGGVIDHYRRNPVDVFLNASESEGVPVSIMEAQSCGIPVVATAVGGTPEIVDDDNGALLAADPTPEAIAAGLEAVRVDGGHKREASRATWRRMSQAEVVYPAFAAELKRLLDGK